MKLSKRQKIGLITILLGMTVLIMDRVFLLPKGAPAEERQYMDEYSAQNNHEVSATDSNSININLSAAEQIKQKLETLYTDQKLDLDHSRDAFSLSETWAQDIGPKVVVDEAASGSAFARKHQLKAVVMNENNIGILLDDAFLAVGEEIDGYILVKVDKESVTFENDGKKVELKLVITE